jgi:predicted lipoprotein with Yx(FWY)xxD motif
MSPRIRPMIAAAAIATILIAGVGACGNAENGAETPPQATAAATVKVSNSALGPILTDQKGRTLYAFTNDKGGASSCADECIATWPALTIPKTATPGAGITAGLLGKTQRAQGATQATYNAWPLYYYVGDAAAGDVNGQNADGAWFVVAATGKLIKTTP